MAGIVGIIIGVIIHHIYHKKFSVVYFSPVGVFREWVICIVIGFVISGFLFGA